MENETIWLYNENCTRRGEVCQDERLIEAKSGDIHPVEGTRDELIEHARTLLDARTPYNRKCGRSILAWFGEDAQ